MQRKKTLKAPKKRIGKTSVCILFLFCSLRILLLTEVYLVLISSDGKTIKDDVSIHISFLFRFMFKYLLALEGTTRRPTSNRILSNGKFQLLSFFFLLFQGNLPIMLRQYLTVVILVHFWVHFFILKKLFLAHRLTLFSLIQICDIFVAIECMYHG